MGVWDGVLPVHKSEGLKLKNKEKEVLAWIKRDVTRLKIGNSSKRCNNTKCVCT